MKLHGNVVACMKPIVFLKIINMDVQGCTIEIDEPLFQGKRKYN